MQNANDNPKTVSDIYIEIESISNSGHPEYSHPNNAARLYQVFQSVGMAIGKRMAELQTEDRKNKQQEKGKQEGDKFQQ